MFMSKFITAVKKFLGLADDFVDDLFDKTDKVMGEVEGTLTEFARFIDKLRKASTELADIVQDCETEIASKTELKAKAEEAIEQYETLRDNLNKLVGGK